MNWSESIYRHADVYAQAAGLAPLEDGGQPEVRVWVDNVMYGEVAGRVTTANHAREYALSWDLDDDGGQMTVTRRASGRAQATSTPTSFTDVVSELQALDGQNWGCATDGFGILIDGVVEERRFTLFVSNPEFCDDDRSRSAVRALNMLGPSNWAPITGRR